MRKHRHYTQCTSFPRSKEVQAVQVRMGGAGRLATHTRACQMCAQAFKERKHGEMESRAVYNRGGLGWGVPAGPLACAKGKACTDTAKNQGRYWLLQVTFLLSCCPLPLLLGKALKTEYNRRNHKKMECIEMLRLPLSVTPATRRRRRL